MADTPEAVRVAQTFVGNGVAQATAPVRLVDRQGTVIERLPVDARELIASGEYEREDVYLARKDIESKAEPAEKPKRTAKD